MSYIKFLSILIFMTCLSSYGQDSGIYQAVSIEKYQGKKFILKGKIYYKDRLTNGSYAVLGASSYDNKGKVIKTPLYNDNAGDYYKQDEWSSYKLTGKIDKKAKYLTAMVAIGGSGSYYLDDFKLFVKDGKDKIEIPLKNPGFESDSLKNWQTSNMDKNTKFSVTKEKAFSGEQSLFIDNSNLELAPTLGNNPKLGKYMVGDGLKLYYEIYGKGKPLLLLHGNNTSMAIFSKQLDALSKNCKVIGLDSRGQGKSTSNNAKITYELMAEDVNTFLDKMQLKNVNILG